MKNLVSLVILVLLVNGSLCSVLNRYNRLKRQQEKKASKQDADYFYDEGMTEEEIKREQEQKRLEKERQDRERTTSTEKPPDWFVQREESPMEQMFKEKCKEYVRQQFDEMAKSKSSGSHINHSVLSVLTLTGFFMTGIIIGITIVLIKGRTFKKNKAASSNTKPNGLRELKKLPSNNLSTHSLNNVKYDKVDQIEQIA